MILLINPITLSWKTLLLTSNKDFNRPNYLDMLSKLQVGNLLYILSIDRLGRNYDEILSQWRLITTDKDVDIVVIDMPILDTRGRHQGVLMGKLVADVVLQFKDLLDKAKLKEATFYRRLREHRVAKKR